MSEAVDSLSLIVAMKRWISSPESMMLSVLA